MEKKMNVIFVSIGGLTNLGENAVYPDLLRCFRDHGHSVYVVCQREKRIGLPTQLQSEYNMQVLRVQTGNITKAGMFEKGISTLLIGTLFKKAIKKYFSNIKFDLVLYSTPPITVATTVKYIKRRDKAQCYLMLKDIFPQNAVDIGILKKTGIMGLIYLYFRRKEKQLYKISDKIGCMSIANMNYLKEHNSYVHNTKINLCPNTINILPENGIDKNEIRTNMKLPLDKVLFVYGGNFGRPQDVDYIIEVLDSNRNRNDIIFVMCGSGTDFYKIKNYICQNPGTNVIVMDSLSTSDYGKLLDACDVGLLFLDHRFTIPNFPSRLLDYLNHSLPVFASTDRNTDVGSVITEGGFGWWCESNNIENYNKLVNEILSNLELIKDMGKNGRKYMETHYNTEVAYKQIMMN
jgi:glycosyltransferase involved in cell wall biosynthesis